MRTHIYRIVLIGILIVMAHTAIAQQFMVKMDGKSEENIFMLIEAMALLVDEDETIQVKMMMPAENRPKGYDNIDLKQGDEILMMNAKRIKVVKDLKEIYDGLDAGETVKLGIRRKEEMFIVSFDKVDPEKMPKRKTMVTREGGGAGVGMTMKLANTGDGLAIKEVGNQVLVHKIFSHLQKVLDNTDFREGDMILSVNSTKIESNQQFMEAFGKIKAGEDVRLVTSREGKQMNVTFKKPEPVSR